MELSKRLINAVGGNMGKGKAPESRERIIRTAVVLFARRGYASIGLRELAEKAEVNLAMINYSFGGKKKRLMIIPELDD